MAITITRSQFKIAKNQVFFYRLLYFLRENISLCESGGIRRPSARKKWTKRKEEEEEKGSRKGKGGVTPVSTFSELVLGVSSFSSFFVGYGKCT